MPRALPHKPIVDKENPLWTPRNLNGRKTTSAKPNAFPEQLQRGLKETTNELESDRNQPQDVAKATDKPRHSIPYVLLPPVPSAFRRRTSKPNPEPKDVLPAQPVFEVVQPQLPKKRKSYHTIANSSRSSSLTTLDGNSLEGNSGFDDLLRAAAKRIKSDLSYDSESFVLDEREGALSLGRVLAESSSQFEAAIGRPTRVQTKSREVKALEEALYGPRFAILEALIDRVATMYPGIRLRERIVNSNPEKEQDVLDVLAKEGLLSFTALSLFRGANIQRLDLSESMREEKGLNQAGKLALKVFKLPNSFQYLIEVDLSYAPMVTDGIKDLVAISGLKVLRLDGSGLNDSHVFQLTSISSTLEHLSVSRNSGITDDSAPVFIHIGKLILLDICGTKVSMIGLRILAKAFISKGRGCTVKLPASCKDYMKSLHERYRLHVAEEPWMVTAISEVDHLSLPELKKNLEAHARRNPSINAKGKDANKLRTRLKSLLEVRQADLYVRALLDLGKVEDVNEAIEVSD